MLRIAREKVTERNAQERILFEVQDCLSMTFDDNSFDVVTVAYGVRNFEHLEDGFREMYRVLSPGGALCVIELSTPERFPFRFLPVCIFGMERGSGKVYGGYTQLY